MWLLLSAVVVCFTIIVLFRMFIDLQRQNLQHQRMMFSDQRDYERYTAVTSRPKPRAEFPDWRPSARQLDDLEALRELERRRAEPFIDPRMTELMRDIDG